MDYKSGVSIPLEEHLSIHFFSPLISIMPTASALLHGRALNRAQLLPSSQFLQPARACPLHSHTAARAQLLSSFSFDLGSLSVVYLEFARLDTSIGIRALATLLWP